MLHLSACVHNRFCPFYKIHYAASLSLLTCIFSGLRIPLVLCGLRIALVQMFNMRDQ